MMIASPASCVVEASAGTGKTRELVAQIVQAIASGIAVDRIVAVTFTHAAAGEMKLRVRQELDRARALAHNDAEAERLKLALQTLDRAFIGTIHSFCAHLLRQRPVDACVDPSFQELSQPEAIGVFARVFRSWIERKLATPSSTLRRALIRVASRDDNEDGEPLDALRKAAWNLADWRDHPEPWSRPEGNRDLALAELVEGARPLLAMRNRCTRFGDELYRKLQPVADFLERVDRSKTAGALDLDVIEGDVLRLPYQVKWPPRGNVQYAPGITRDAMVTAWEQYVGEIDEYRKTAEADLAAALRDELWDVVLLYARTKQKAGQLDFTDLLIHARDLLRHREAREYLQRRYDRIYIDEFQDTDPLQAEILLLLAAENPDEAIGLNAAPAPSKLFVVGDPKQSIYRFRRADAKLYGIIRDRLIGSGVASRRLSVSHRSVAPIQHFVNAAFCEEIPDYLPLEGGPPSAPNQPAVVALPMPEPYGTRNISKAEIIRCSPAAVAAFIDWLINESGWTVREPDTHARIPIQPEHICVLFRRFTNWGVDLTQEYVRELEARAIEHVLVGSKSFHQREEVGTLRTALRAIEWPDDSLSVYAVLRGSLFAIADGTLLKFWHQHKRFHPYMELPEDLDPEFEPVRDGLQLLMRLHRRRNYQPVADTMNALIEHTRAHAGFALRKGGERVLANVFRLSDLARSFEATSATSFRSFIEHLEHEAEAGETTEAPVLEQQAAGVKLMTVHKAKGLEFPVVILADLTAKLTGAEGGDRYVDTARGLCAQRLIGCRPWELLEHDEEEARADREEGWRLAYVAATRARDLLVVSAIGEQQPEEGWLTPLYDALYPARDRWRTPSKALGCPAFGNSTVLNRPPEMRDETSVRPGLHVPKAGTHDVVWFDPALLKRTDSKDQGLDREELLQGTPEQTRAGIAAYEHWRDRRAQAVVQGSEARWRVKRIIDLGEVPEASHIKVEVVSAGTESARPGGRRFGRLVHAVLQLAAGAVPIEAIARSQGRRLRCPEDEISAAIEAVRVALEHPLLKSCVGPQCHRELPVMLRLADGSLAEGNIDLAWFDGTTWTVIDYKTDSAGQQRYRRQLQVYGLALQRATNQPVRCLLFEV